MSLEGQPLRLEVDARCKTRVIAKGEAVYRQGEPSTEIYRLVSGAVKLCSYSVEGREFVASGFRAGDCFGEMGVIDGLPRVSHAEATEDCVLNVLSKTEFDRFVKKYPEFSQQVMVMLCRRLRFAYAVNAETSGLALHQRLALHLYRLAYSQGSPTKDGEFVINISQEELGRMLGASRQTVNKELKKLVSEGSVDLRYGKIYVTDLECIRSNYEYLMGAEQIAATYEDLSQPEPQQL